MRAAPHVTVDTGCSEDGLVRALAIHVPGSGVHVVTVSQHSRFDELSAALLMTNVRGFDPRAPHGLEVAFDSVWDAKLAAANLFAGTTQPPRELHHVQLMLGLEYRSASVTVSRFPSAEELQMLAKRTGELTLTVDVLTDMIDDAGLAATVALDIEVVPILRQMARIGIGLDRKSWRAARYEMEAKERSLRESLPEVLGIATLDDEAGILDRLQARGLKLDSLKSDELRRHSDLAVISALLEWRRLRAFVNNDAKNITSALERSGDGRVHPTWHVLGTVNGLITATDPSLLSVANKLKVHFVPAAGHVFVHADLSAVQLRILAEVTGEKSLIDVFRRGADPHTATAKFFSAANTAIDRSRAKPINFGVPFGMTARGLVESARANFNVMFSLQDAERYIKRYFDVYPGIAEWKRRIAATLPSETRSLGGRRHRFGASDDEVGARLAAPMQGTQADAMKRALVALAAQLSPLGGRLVAVAYDAVTIEAPREKANDVRLLAITSLEQGLQFYLKRVPVVVSADIRETWGR